MLESGHRVTIKDVAAQSGVSTQTVSRVINNRPDVASDTRERVEDVIATLGYRPSAVARTLVARRSNAIGVLLAGMGYTGTVLTLRGIIDESASLGLTVLIAELPEGDSLDDPRPAISALIERHVDGIIMSVPAIGPGSRPYQSGASRPSRTGRIRQGRRIGPVLECAGRQRRRRGGGRRPSGFDWQIADCPHLRPCQLARGARPPGGMEARPGQAPYRDRSPPVRGGRLVSAKWSRRHERPSRSGPGSRCRRRGQRPDGARSHAHPAGQRTAYSRGCGCHRLRRHRRSRLGCATAHLGRAATRRNGETGGAEAMG